MEEHNHNIAPPLKTMYVRDVEACLDKAHGYSNHLSYENYGNTYA